MANKKYKLTDGNYWATDGVYDFDQGKTQREVNSDLSGAITEINDCLEGKTIVLLGDSNAYNWGATNPFSDVKDVTFHNLAVGGAAFSTQNNNNIEAQYNRMVSSGYSPDYVIIWAGGNDLAYYPDWGLPELGTYTEPNATTTFESMRRLLYKLRANYPATKLFGVVRNNKTNVQEPVARYNYVMGLVERIYAAWGVPVLSFDSISNITQEIPQSLNQYFNNDGFHYNANGLRLFTNQIKNALRGALVTHSVRKITTLFAPTTCTTVDSASAWVVDNLFKGTSSWANWYLEQQGYLVKFITNPTASQSEWVQGESMIFTFAPAVGLYTDGRGTLKMRDTVALGNSNNHVIPFCIDGESQITTLKNLKNGITGFRLGNLNANTDGVPTALQSILNNSAGRIIGSWQSNDRWQGMLLITFTNEASLSDVAYVLILRTDASNDASFRSFNNPSTVYTAQFSN